MKILSEEILYLTSPLGDPWSPFLFLVLTTLPFTCLQSRWGVAVAFEAPEICIQLFATF